MRFSSLDCIDISKLCIIEYRRQSSVTKYSESMKIKHIDHIGINVEKIEAAKQFFIDLGFTVMGEAMMQGELVDRITGLKNVKDDSVMLQAPDGQLNLELVKFHHPVDEAGVQSSSANTLGLRHLCFEVEELDNIVSTLEQKGHKLVGDIQTYEKSWKLCYIRGPEGIILELAQKLQ